MSAGDPEVVVVGAGFAGLVAAYELARHGVSVVVLEASSRLGGRAESVYDCGHEVSPVELGPEFVHGEPAETLRLLAAAGIKREPVPERQHRWRDGALVPDDDMWDRFATLLEPAGWRADEGPRGDASARAHRDRSQLAPHDAELFRMLVEGFYAAPLADISITSIASDAGAGAQSRVRGGYGKLIDWLAAQLVARDVRIHTSFPVRRIRWDRGRAEIHGEDGRELVARRAIVTVPLSILHDRLALAFEPELGDHRAALAQLAMGQVVKLVLCLRPAVDAARDLAFVHRAAAQAFPTFWFHAGQITAWAGGPRATRLAGLRRDELVERALADLAVVLGVTAPQLEASLVHAHHRDYARDPLTRGAYSYTRVGGTHAASTLARPLGDTLFLAGEATDAQYEGSVGGALASGVRAARAALNLALGSGRTEAA